MIVEPKFRGFICTTSHPTGCKKNVENQIEYIKEKGKIDGEFLRCYKELNEVLCYQ